MSRLARKWEDKLTKKRNRSTYVIFVLILFCVFHLILPFTLMAQEEKSLETSPSEKVRTQVFNLKNAHPGQLAQQLKTFFPQAKISHQHETRQLIVQTNTEIMASIKELIKALDRPMPVKRNIELTIHLMIASDQPSSDNIEGDLRAVVEELSKTFSYKAYRLLDRFVFRTRDGSRAEFSGQSPLPSGSKGAATFYKFEFRSVQFSEIQEKRFVTLDQFVFELGQDPADGPKVVSEMSATITLEEGQIGVIGKSSVGGPNNALIVAVVARVLD